MEYYEYLEHRPLEEFHLTMDMVHYLAESLFINECQEAWHIFCESNSVEEVKRKFDSLASMIELPLTDNWDEVSQLKKFIFIHKLHFMAKIRIEKIIKGELNVQPTLRIGISELVKKDVLSIGKCAFCGSTLNLQVDHIVPLAKGGSNHRANLQCLCEVCNKSKNSKHEAEIIADLRKQLFQLRRDE